MTPCRRTQPAYARRRRARHVERALAPAERPGPVLALRPRAQELRAHHRRGRQRHQQRHDDRRRQRDGEFAEKAPDDAAHHQDGDEYRDQRHAHRQHGEADFLRARPAPPSCGGMPSSMWRDIFSSTTIASSTTKPVAIVSAISDRLLSYKPHRYMTPNVPISDTGTATLGNQRRAHVAQEHEHHQDDQDRPR